MDSQPVKTPKWVLVYEGTNASEVGPRPPRDITAQITNYVTSVSFTEHLSGEADEIEIVLEDSQFRWKNAWLPTKGDRIALSFGYVDSPMVKAGSYQIDEVEFSGPPDTVSVRGIAAPIKPDLRTQRSIAYEKTTLAGIAAKIAAKHALKVMGVAPAISIERATQHRETDLSFLHRLASKYGIAFSVRGAMLVWYDQDALDGKPAVATITRKHLAGTYHIRSKSAHVYRGCRVTYFNPKLKKDVTTTITLHGVIGGDVLTLVERFESREQAKKAARAAIRRANGRQTEGDMTVFGDPRLMSGVNIQLSGWGVLDGAYQIVKTTHRIDRGVGYKTVFDFGLNGTFGMKSISARGGK
jgi:uncharacterized protein